HRSGSEQSNSIRWSLEKRQKPESAAEERGGIVPDERDYRKDRQKTVNDARYGRQQLDQECQPVGSSQGCKLSKKNGCPDPERNSKNQRKERRHQCPIDKRQCSEIQPDRIPDPLDKKIPAEFLSSERRSPVELKEKESGYQNDRRGENKG